MLEANHSQSLKYKNFKKYLGQCNPYSVWGFPKMEVVALKYLDWLAENRG